MNTSACIAGSAKKQRDRNPKSLPGSWGFDLTGSMMCGILYAELLIGTKFRDAVTNYRHALTPRLAVFLLAPNPFLNHKTWGARRI